MPIENTQITRASHNSFSISSPSRLIKRPSSTPFFPSTTMALHSTISLQNSASSSNNLLKWIQNHAPNSAQIVGFISVLISAILLLIITVLTVSGATLSLMVFGPLLLITSPVWIPLGVLLFVLIAGAASVVGSAIAVLAVATWLYRYLTGRHPFGSDQIDFARSRIADTAIHVKDYACECGEYLQSRIKDAAPGA